MSRPLSFGNYIILKKAEFSFTYEVVEQQLQKPPQDYCYCAIEILKFCQLNIQSFQHQRVL